MANFLGSTEAPWVDAPLHAVSHAENNCMPQDETRSSLKDFDTKASHPLPGIHVDVLDPDRGYR